MVQHPTELIAIRHVETVWNQEARLQGHSDSPITSTGRKQIEAIAERLSKEPFSALYSSDLKRSFETATGVSKRTGHEVHIDPRLRERNFGIFEGYTKAEILQKFPQDHAQFETGNPEYMVPEGESRKQRYDRIIQCANEIIQKHAGERIVIISHGGVLTDFLRCALDIPFSSHPKFKLLNAAINRFFVQNRIWKLSVWGDTEHLKNIGTIDHW
ncbi:MAG: histidine phosphatase family protein [Candidatus Aureabacteria bacterium]|nr:histidine phosphatase family protein [Candidatus Auribacterota bacterium]